jgi:hypothetical protein
VLSDILRAIDNGDLALLTLLDLSAVVNVQSAGPNLRHHDESTVESAERCLVSCCSRSITALPPRGVVWTRR